MPIEGAGCLLGLLVELPLLLLELVLGAVELLLWVIPFGDTPGRRGRLRDRQRERRERRAARRRR